MKNLKHLLSAVTSIALAFFVGVFVASATGLEQFAVPIGAATTLLTLIPQSSANGVLKAIVITDILTEWGAFYRAGGQGVKDLLTKLRQRSVTAQYFPTRVTENTIMEKSVADFARVLQRFQKGWTPIGTTTFTPTKIPLYKLKIDLQETPDDLEESWLGFLADGNLDRRQWPFIRWYLENALIKADEDLELNEIYKGVVGTITPGTATAAGASLQGIKAQLNAHHAAGNLGTVTMGAVPTTDAEDFVDYVEDFINNIPRLLRRELDFLFVNEDLHDLFRDGMRAKYNTNYEQVADSRITKLRNDNINLVGLPSMDGSTRIWTTPKFNRQGGFKKPKNERIFEVEKVDREVKAYTDYYKGYGFWIPQYVYSNDVELT